MEEDVPEIEEMGEDMELAEEMWAADFEAVEDGEDENLDPPPLAEETEDQKKKRLELERSYAAAVTLQNQKKKVHVDATGHALVTQIATKWKRWTKKQMQPDAAGKVRSVAEMKKLLYFASGQYGTPILLNGKTQLDKWCAADYPRGTGDTIRYRKMDNENPHEQALFVFYTERRSTKQRVTSMLLLREYERIATAKMHKHAFFRWRQRHSLVWRSVQRATTRTTDDIKVLLQSFHVWLYNIRTLFIPVAWINYDEIPWSFSGSMSTSGTISHRGDDNVVVRENPNHDKRCGSFIPLLGVRQLGNAWESIALRPAFLLRREAKKPLVPSNPGKILYSESDSGVVTTHFIVNILYPYIRLQLETLQLPGDVGLVFDSASGHKSDISMAVAKKYFKVAVIPGGLTSYVQPVDVEYAKRVREYYREELHGMYVPAEGETVGGLSGKKQLDLMMGWVSQAHRVVAEKCDMVRIFERTGISSHTKISIKGVPSYSFAVPVEAPVLAPAKLPAKTPPKTQPTLEGLGLWRKRARTPTPVPAEVVPVEVPAEEHVEVPDEDDEDPTIDEVTQMS